MAIDSLLTLTQNCIQRQNALGRYLHFDYSKLVIVSFCTPTPIESSVYQPLLCLVLQGEKQVSAGEHQVRCSQARMILVSHHIPVISQITQASDQTPYVAVILPLDREKLLRYFDPTHTTRPVDDSAAIGCHQVPNEVAQALGRLIELANEPTLAPMIAPLIEDEIHARLMHSEIGQRLMRLVWHSDKSAQVAKIIKLINDDLSKNLSIAELAKESGMSRSALHQHFKAITGMSPLAYTKELRLLKAQTLVRESSRPIASIGFDVGYDNHAQFSREYARKFDKSPRQDRATAAGIS
ncbi:Helix-turn-helix domain-containing protein [Amphritea atlantica]|uniref:Helix-turn-helix domain-containing protein n=1 Tax=Amphritea atlantica TaxID=355243 RepID=A0A1H9KUJ8_9GAMM|nr:AraC family transcriptional regulator [Amphritea atlantica]SER02615.1 Helix-turn-helix domain-containing protein [Amphritea atlantica]